MDEPCAIPDPSDEAARLMGWHMAEVSAGPDFDGRERTRCVWVNAAGETVIDVWDFRAWPRLAEEIVKRLTRGA